MFIQWCGLFRYKNPDKQKKKKKKKKKNERSIKEWLYNGKKLEIIGFTSDLLKRYSKLDVCLILNLNITGSQASESQRMALIPQIWGPAR